MNAARQREAAKKFVEYWKDKAYEKGEAQPFWLALLREVFGIDQPEKWILFEGQVKVADHKSPTPSLKTNFIDARIPATKVLVEQKSADVDLRNPEKQSDGSWLTPYQQAKKYADNLPNSERPRWIVACNFREFHIHDMEKPNAAPTVVKLENFPKEYYLLEFLVKEQSAALDRETQISITAGEIVGRIYDAFLKEYKDPNSLASQRSLNILCVRLVFCLYAEDADVFERNQFHDYLEANSNNPRGALIDLFKVLDKKKEERDPYLDELLDAFPYVNGGLFKDENIEIPTITPEIRDLILHDASKQFDWSDINPTIFGAVFESTLNPETRRQGGMHYTSVENIHKVIDPLFLDELREEFEKIRAFKQGKKIRERVAEFQKKLGSLTFLDPACGSGNFLTETYLSLRRLENEALRLYYPKGTIFSIKDKGAVVKVSLDQFYGIEINDFAVSVAKTALWIAESQMLQETEGILDCQLDFLPLTNYDQIVEANALRIDWNDVVDKNKLNYIMGNPPFVGYGLQTSDQKNDVKTIYSDEMGKPYPSSGKIDYVSCWYFKACQFMQGTPIKTALVSTNSITQGDQVQSVWAPLYQRFGVQIIFAYRTFRWNSEAANQAQVHCVIVGFNTGSQVAVKTIYSGVFPKEAKNINPYLLDAPNVMVGTTSKPLCDVPQMTAGNRPTDGGNLIIEEKDYDAFIKAEPNAKRFIKQLVGAEEFINNKKRYCLWLVDAMPAEIRSMPLVMKRVEACRQTRLASPDPGCQKLAERPTQFRETMNPDAFLIVPSVSSERRRYIPIGFMDRNTIATNLVLILPNATLYHFGVLTSSVHMGWMRTVCGRLKSDYRYSAKIVYNNFPWPEASEDDEEKIAATAQGILDARKLYPDSSFADLYDETTMPIELRKAHQANDRAVMKAYGFKPDMSESEIVAKLMERYEELT